MVNMETVHSERLTIHPLKLEEILALAEKYKGDPTGLDQAYMEMYGLCVEHSDDYLWYAPWEICLKDSFTRIGDIGFKGIVDGSAEVGYGTDPEFEGNGYATEAVGAMRKWAFGTGRVNCVEAETDPDNVASQKVLLKNGFTATGVIGEEGPRFAVERPKKAVIYVHGKGGSVAESDFYKSYFPDSIVMGIDYTDYIPWIVKSEICSFYERVASLYDEVSLITNSIGTFLAMHALNNVDDLSKLKRAYFVSPILDMERLIQDMMSWAGVTESELKEKGEIPTDFGETLSWEYLCYVRTNPITWTVPTSILYASKDFMTSIETVKSFVESHDASLTVYEEGEHWFHTSEQMNFLGKWISEEIKK